MFVCLVFAAALLGCGIQQKEETLKEKVQEQKTTDFADNESASEESGK